ncbi:UxaA family hydrolase, partial [Belliella pelovolcani]|uniref:UxaA family hydrolase n=1 Tax=Belliella pelovolcani TaxID=529505 RepID=UPI0039190471
MNHKFLQIHPDDNVLVALTDLEAGNIVNFKGNDILLKNQITAKHKFAISPIAQGNYVFMYGSIVGKAVSDIDAGEVLTTTNVHHEANSFSEKTETTGWISPDISRFANRTFNGFHRKDGQVGTANYWIVIPLVFCENRNVEVIKDAFVKELGFSKPNPFKSLVQKMASLYKSGNKAAISSLQVEEVLAENEQRIFKNIDGIKFLTHQGGCGGIRQDSNTLCALL